MATQSERAMIATGAQDEVWAGKHLGTKRFVVAAGIVSRYTGSLRLRNGPRAERISGELLAPPIVLTEAENGFEGNHFSNRFGELWIREEWAFERVVRIGESLSVKARVLDVYPRRDRVVVATEHVIARPGGERVARSVHHNSFMAHQMGGDLKLPDPNRDPPRLEPEGEPLRSTEYVITTEMCRQFYENDPNYHTDRSAARALGFADVVVGGGMTMACLFDLLTDRFGRGWLEGGRLDLKFINVLHPGEPFTCSGVITGRSEGGRKRAEVAVWARKADGTNIIAGTASALE